MDENFRAIAGGEEPETFALVVPLNCPALSLSKCQDMTASWAMVRIHRILLLLPTCLHESDSTILANQVTIGGEYVNVGEQWFNL
jgi:hypothetical protein